MPSVAEFRRPHLPFPIVSRRPDVQEHYNRCRLEGTSHQLAEMFALQAAPSLQTDTRWIAETKTTLDPNTLNGRRLIEEARAAGVNPEGKAYMGGLADYPGDPRAWVESRGDCLRLAEERGITLEGSINYKPPDTGPSELPSKDQYRVADDIVEERWQDAVAADPGLAAKRGAKEELAETISGRA